MEEIWKNVSELKGFEPYNKYFISNFGRIKSLHRGKEIIMKNTPNSKGYPQVGLCNGTGRSSRKTVHIYKLVALAFVKNSNPSVNIVINHIDMNKENSNFSNLEWTTQKDNVNKFISSDRAEEYKKRLSDSLKAYRKANPLVGIGRKMSDENKKLLISINTGKKLSEETKKKISDSHKEYHKRNPGKKLSEETKKKISDSHKEYHNRKKSA